MGDTLIIDFDVRNKETQEPIPTLQQSRHELDCLQEENFLPGVMPKMMGMKVGEISTFDFNFPDPWEPVELAGVKASVCSHELFSYLGHSSSQYSFCVSYIDDDAV